MRYNLLAALILGAATSAISPITASGVISKDNTTDPKEAVDVYKLKGKIKDAKSGEALPRAQITVLGTSIGLVADNEGHFMINNLPRKRVTLRVRYTGYETKEIIIPADSKDVTIRLTPAEFNMEEVVVSANRTETRRHLAPVLVNVTDAKLFTATNSVSLDEALRFNPGIRVEDNCQNCGFNQVRINGLDGAYSQVVINSRSIFSSLAAVYGLEMLPTSMIDRVEVVRGGGSALYGSSAIGGTINIITKTPTHNSATAEYTMEAYQDNYSSPAHNMGVATSILSDDSKVGLTVFGRIKQREGLDFVRPGSQLKADKEKGLDAGKDGYTEMPRLFSSTVGINTFANISPLAKLTLDYFYTQESRRGGDALDRPEHEANIAESLGHRIHTGILRYDRYLFDGNGYLTAFAAGSNTIRNSFYGGGAYIPEKQDDGSIKVPEDASPLTNYGLTKDLTIQAGVQYVHNFDKLLFMPAELTTGFEYNYNKLNDNSGYRPLDLAQKVSTRSVILQNEWKDDTFAFLLGLRYDNLNLNTDEKQSVEALRKLNIITPRATFRYNPTHDLHFRLSYAHGFRAPQYFDEELHIAFAGGEGVPRVLSKDLKEERSRSFTGSVDWYNHDIENVQINLMAEGFYTRLLDKFNAEERELSGSKYLEVVNAGKAAVYGVNLEARVAYAKLFNLQTGLTLQKSLFDEETEIGVGEIKSREFMRTPNVYGYFVLGWTPTSRFGVNLFGDYSGKMWVPHEAGEKVENYITSDEDKLVHAPSFFTLGTKLTYTVKVSNTSVEFNAGINNMFNSYQKDFDEGPNRASAYVYGPKAPRSIFCGVKLSI
ncbi:TonB-dependent receptor [Porphyromonas sp.]|uniref:TonB-dependent receptor n=1 Tax=Porphyromonas sp. TaxID=1924944 RepID=UPI0026DAFDFC|nr:TonB-dependent receptor [Porphyromonas sp.]MDO4695868.1 TonB-dependent receptor [Porphyromonas sp.]MDO4770348.1 TonB-dependent receptor [Porphyromonas sp.]